MSGYTSLDLATCNAKLHEGQLYYQSLLDQKIDALAS